MADRGPSDPQDAPRESLQEAREAAEETVQKLEELEVRLDQEPDPDGLRSPWQPPSRGHTSRDDSDADADVGYDAPQAPRESIDISQLDTGHPDGGPE